jgi:hypothetical protein
MRYQKGRAESKTHLQSVGCGGNGNHTRKIGGSLAAAAGTRADEGRDAMNTQKTVEGVARQVNPENMGRAPGPYGMSFGFDLTPLIQSIERIGLLNPPLLVEEEKGTFIPVTGYRRIQALNALKWPHIPCRVLHRDQVSPLDCLLLNLYDNLTTRAFNVVEKGMIFNRLATLVDVEAIRIHYLPLLDLPANEKVLFLYMAIDRELPHEIKETIARGRMALPVAQALLDMDADDREQVFRAVQYLNFNINQQKQFIEYLDDICQIKKESVSVFLSRFSRDPVWSDPNLNTPQRAKAVIRSLRGQRFPFLSDAEKSFKARVSRLDLPQDVRIGAPPFFEGSHYRLEVRFKDGTELKQHLDRLSRTHSLLKLGHPWEGDD